MNDDIEENRQLGPYQVESVEKVSQPKGMLVADWYRYIIGQGRSRIEGLKPGSLETVMEHAQSVAEDLNTRHAKGSTPYYVTRKPK